MKPKYQRKKGGSILKTLVTNPFAKALVLGAASGAAKTFGKRKLADISGAAKTFGKRKLDDIINTANKLRKVNGKGIAYE